MKHFTAVLLAALLLSAGAAANEPVQLNDEVRIPLPVGWSVAEDMASLSYPLTLVSPETGAELLIFRSVLPKDGMILSKEHLTESVKQVIDDVVLQLPNATFLTSEGTYYGHKAGFSVEFTSTDSASGDMIRHRLASAIYRTSSDQQVMFTLWGRGPAASYPAAEGAIKTMQSGFAFAGHFEPEVFGESNLRLWLGTAAVIACVGFFLFLRLRRRAREGQVKDEGWSYWRCGCGQMNPQRADSCRKCASPRTATPVT